eukprot:6452719-Prymnesium_polylepis.1
MCLLFPRRRRGRKHQRANEADARANTRNESSLFTDRPPPGQWRRDDSSAREPLMGVSAARSRTAPGTSPCLKKCVSLAYCRVVVTDSVAHATLHQTFVNQTVWNELEVTYTFPALPSATVVGLTVRTADDVIDGRVAPKSQARQEYQESVAH